MFVNVLFKGNKLFGWAELNWFTSWKDPFISQFSCTRSWLRVNVRGDALSHWLVPFVVCHWMGCVQDSKHTRWSCTAIHIYDIIQSNIVHVGSHLTGLHTGKGTVPHTWLYNEREHLPCIIKKTGGWADDCGRSFHCQCSLKFSMFTEGRTQWASAPSETDTESPKPVNLPAPLFMSQAGSNIH